MSAPLEHPYAAFVHEVEKPVRYLGGEHGSRHRPWDPADVHVVLAFPDLYEIGMSHLGFRILYELLNTQPGLVAERAYAPWSDMEAQLRARGLPLVSLESARPLTDFDVVGFSLQFELTYTNVLLMLELGGLPLRAADRTDTQPLVLAGGPTATHAEPLAPFIDAFALGDGEELAPAAARLWRTTAGRPRPERLRRLASLPGIYVPSLYRTRFDAGSRREVVDGPMCDDVPATVRRAHVADLDRYPFPPGGPVAATETIFDRVSVEIARGCTEGCRFCQAGMIYRPARERSPESIIDTVLRAVREGGYDEASLTSLSTADYSCITPLVHRLMAALAGQQVSLAVSSLRAYGLSDDLLGALQSVRETGLTFAPEAGTQRLRDVVNKNVDAGQIEQSAERVFARGWSKMKLYFMLGLPTETDADLQGIVDTGVRLRAIGRRGGRGAPAVTVSVSTHAPKPHTPFQWCAMDGPDEIARKQALLRAAAWKQKLELRLHDARGSVLEGVLARGDRRLAPVVEQAYRAGARFDSWEDRLRWDLWTQALADAGLDPLDYLAAIPLEARLPWDHVDMGVERRFLEREHRRALEARTSPPCSKPVGQSVHHATIEDAREDARRLVCYDCGAGCDLDAMGAQRLARLQALDAHRVEPVAPPPPPAPVDRHRPRPGVVQGEARRYRIAFQRTGRAAFQGHLDLIKLLGKVFRRAGIALHYSQGFHPKPEMTFGPALALGVATLAEYADVRLAVDVDASTLPARLTAGAPEGLVFTRALGLAREDPSLSKAVDVCEFVAAIEPASLAGREVAELLAAASGRPLTVERTSGKTRKTVDVGAYLLSVEAGGAELLRTAGMGDGWAPLRFRLKVTDGGTARPAEVIAVLLGEGVHARFVRSFVGTERDGRLVGPMELEALREVTGRSPAP